MSGSYAPTGKANSLNIGIDSRSQRSNRDASAQKIALGSNYVANHLHTNLTWSGHEPAFAHQRQTQRSAQDL